MNPTKVINIRGKPFDPDVIYIGRGSQWGNDWSHKQGTTARYVVGTREEAIEAYRLDLWEKIKDEGVWLIYELETLYGQTLGCYCAPLPCHGDVLARAAEWAYGEIIRMETGTA